MRAWLKQLEGFYEDAQQIRDDYIGRRELGESTITPKLNLNSANNSVFQKFVVSDAPIDEVRKHLRGLKKHDRNYNLLTAIIVCRDRVRKIADGSLDTDAAARALIKIVKYMQENVRVVRFIVDDDSAAYTIFETLNDRGLDLTTIDLVKNYLFGRITVSDAGRIRELEDRWAQMMFTLANVKANDFLKAFWTSRHGRVQKDYLFQELKREHKSSNSANELSTAMLQAAEQYAALDSADDPVWAPYSLAARETIGSLKVIGAAQTHPIILAGLEKFRPNEFERLLRLLETIIVRYQLIGGERTGRLEIQCAKTSKEIYDGTITTASQARESLKDVYLSDEEFRRAFEIKQERAPPKAHYILKKLEIEERRQKSQDGGRVMDPGIALTVEHILPRNPGIEWAEVIEADKEIVGDCVYRLGNLCLLGKSNKDLGARGFGEKRAAYEKTEVLTTSQLASASTWDRTQIEQRQGAMAKKAVGTWRFD